MAIIKFTNSKSTLKNIINYITKDSKTNAELITGKDCSSDNALEEMQTIKNLYNKTAGRQYVHLIQSFSPNDNLSFNQAHKIGLQLAEQYKGFQVLVATHTDKDHIHNHLVINSVSFENGKKIQQSQQDMLKIKKYSNELCAENGLTTINLKSNSKINKNFSLNEYKVAIKGNSWKLQLKNAIDISMAKSFNKDEFIKNMNTLGYQVTWTDTRKYITYTTPTGMKCRDNKLLDEKYLKENMEIEFDRKKLDIDSNLVLNNENIIHNSSKKVDNYMKTEYFNEKQNSKNIFSLTNLLPNILNTEYPPKRKIRGFVNLSKQAKKEWFLKHKNSNSFDWFEEDEWEM